MENRKPHNEFMKDVDEAKSLPVQVGKYVNEDCQSPSDLRAVERMKREYQEKFDADGSMVEATKEALSERDDVLCEETEDKRC